MTSSSNRCTTTHGFGANLIQVALT